MWRRFRTTKSRMSPTPVSGWKQLQLFSVLITGQISFVWRAAQLRPCLENCGEGRYRQMLENRQEPDWAGSGLSLYHFVASTRKAQNNMIASINGSGMFNIPVSAMAFGNAVAPGPVNSDPAAMK